MHELILQLQSDQGTAIFVEKPADLFLDGREVTPNKGKILWIVCAFVGTREVHPVRKAAVSTLAVYERANSEVHEKASLPA